jgi:hypothetical protein
MKSHTRAVALAAAILVGMAGAADAQGRGNGQGSDKPKEQQAQRPSQADRQKPEQARQSQADRQRPEQAQRPSQADRQRPQQAPRADRQANPQQRGRPSAGRPTFDGAAPGSSGRSNEAAARNDDVTSRWKAAAARPARRVQKPVRLELLPARLQGLTQTDRPGSRAAAAALARGHEHNPLPVSYTYRDDRLRVANIRNQVLFEMDDDEARRLGYWDIRRMDPRGVRDDAPAFCRSGAGHPVWGREWCIDKGFGLGGSDGWLWGRHRPDDVEFLRIDERQQLERGSLIDLLGSVIFNRLALHTVSLGLVDPLAGRWLGQPDGPRVLTLHSGERPVAEMVDWDRDGNVDVMYVTSR